jgi:hypothetical protein
MVSRLDPAAVELVVPTHGCKRMAVLEDWLGLGRQEPTDRWKPVVEALVAQAEPMVFLEV